MGQKSNPIGLRLGVNKTWDSKWFAEKEYLEYLHEDLKIKKYIFGIFAAIKASKDKKYTDPEIAKIEIERPSVQKIRVIINTAKPGVIIGRGGSAIQEMKNAIEKMTKRKVSLYIQEIKDPYIDAQLVANSIASQIEKRISFRRAMKKAVDSSLAHKVDGIKVSCSGRLGGAEIARIEKYMKGRVPLHTLRANIDFARATAHTTYGCIGVKVWLCHGEVLSDRDSERYNQKLKGNTISSDESTTQNN
ncbi:MAG: 30S ribosomal protein S3 [Candidatus Wallbacteria bacterium]